ncbi:MULTISPECIES: hypothetical protein [Inquilinus]|jgi:hypothetical protein|uniref:DUF4384 domain-containing protein n=1 Tax=Inquilinus ginsengisoli TaxID=363840 RepID=A0ABU1JV39_9PROT|nr:hypothetical protein [Inquilinus ginsengisoli]MDR6292494.1 hypothetical protein [Inquilinus ginsengisoli]
MRLRPSLVAMAVMAAAASAQAQGLLNQPGLPPTVQPSTPTPAQPLIAPGLPSRPEPQLTAPAAPAANLGGQEGPGRIIQLDQRQVHPNGVVVTLTSITFRADSIVVAASILNPSGRAAWLNRNGTLSLADDLGRSYRFVPPTDNPEVQIAPQSQVSASFVFVGPIDAEARSVQLATNGQIGSRVDRLTAAPLFLFRMPVS